MEAILMEALELVPLLTFVAVTSYTPGPNNVSSASMGLVFGFLRSLPYLLGVTSGFILMMLLCGTMSSLMIKLLPSVSQWLRWVGFSYIMWLAYGTLRSSYAFDGDNEIARMGFIKGVFLQVVNVKVIIYGITLYTTFLTPLAGQPATLVMSALLLGIIGFSSVALWALCGTALKRTISDPKLKKYINISLSLLLVYTAFSLLHLS